MSNDAVRPGRRFFPPGATVELKPSDVRTNPSPFFHFPSVNCLCHLEKGFVSIQSPFFLRRESPPPPRGNGQAPLCRVKKFPPPPF